MEITPLGDSALLLRVRETFEDAPDETLDEVLAYFDFLRRAQLPGITDLAPAYTTIAIFYDTAAVVAAGAHPDSIFEWLGGRIQTAIANGQVRLRRTTGSVIEIPVCYDDKFALDLDEVTNHVRLSAKEVVERHSNAAYRVNCVGFTAGFPYLSGLPRELATPRRSVPRKEVPAGSVAIGGNQTGIYSIASPGGWNVIGRTPLHLFNPNKIPPAFLCAGDSVRFRAITPDEFESLKR